MSRLPTQLPKNVKLHVKGHTMYTNILACRPRAKLGPSIY